VAQPVYPMKLTASAESNTRVELLVIANSMAGAEGFRRVAADRFLRRGDKGGWGSEPFYRSQRTWLTIGSLDIGDLMWPGCCVTKLTATLSPDEMDRDVDIAMTPLTPHRDRVFSERGRRERGLTILMSGAAIVILLVALGFGGGRRASRREILGMGAVAVLVLVVTGAAYLSTDVIVVESGRNVGWVPMRVHVDCCRIAVEDLVEAGILHEGLSDEVLATLPEMIVENDATMSRSIDNPLTGERMRFERSPGNFSVRGTDAGTFVCFYNLDTQEHRVLLPPKPPKSRGGP
jgi:hypothetical protein